MHLLCKNEGVINYPSKSPSIQFFVSYFSKMGTFPFCPVFVFKLSLLYLVVSFSSSPCFASAEVDIPESRVPFQNLIPRFKMPPGNLLRYRIPQWEVLYFLKYGIVPFVFFNPNFNRTNFISQVHKFKMYFDDGLPNADPVKDEASFRELLKSHNYPNYEQFPENAYSENKKVAEEILRAALSKAHLEAENPNSKLSPIDIFLENLENSSQLTSDTDNVTAPAMKKSGESIDRHRLSRMFWNAFINRYPFSWKYSKALLGKEQEFPLPLIQSDEGPRSGPVDRRHEKLFRIGTRNVDFNNAAAGDGSDDEASRTGSGGEPRRGGKNFQTQGWKK